MRRYCRCHKMTLATIRQDVGSSSCHGSSRSFLAFAPDMEAAPWGGFRTSAPEEVS